MSGKLHALPDLTVPNFKTMLFSDLPGSRDDLAKGLAFGKRLITDRFWILDHDEEAKIVRSVSILALGIIASRPEFGGMGIVYRRVMLQGDDIEVEAAEPNGSILSIISGSRAQVENSGTAADLIMATNEQLAALDSFYRLPLVSLEPIDAPVPRRDVLAEQV